MQTRFCSEVLSDQRRYVPVEIKKTIRQYNSREKLHSGPTLFASASLHNFIIDHPNILPINFGGALRTSCQVLWSGNYLLRAVIVGNIGLDTKGPFNMQLVFVQLHQEYDQDEKGVHHKEGKYTLVSKILQVASNTCLMQAANELIDHSRTSTFNKRKTWGYLSTMF